jgi:hypothetical protein
VKHARRLATRAFRADQREFLAEGPQAVREALDHEGAVLEVFATASATEQHVDLAEAARRGQVAWHVVDDDVVVAIADTVQPQGVVARCAMLDRPLSALLDRSPGFVVVCADIRDPGNAGAVIRCADAAGADGVVFVGDTLFAMGCGRLFEGTAEQMFDNMVRLAALPAETSVYCAHEYTQSNGRYALVAEPDNDEIRARMIEVDRKRAEGEATVPTTIAAERATNPFMRATSAQVLAERRAAKDSFRG